MTYIKSAFDVFYTRVQKSCKKKSNLINIDENYFTLGNNDGYKRNIYLWSKERYMKL